MPDRPSKDPHHRKKRKDDDERSKKHARTPCRGLLIAEESRLRSR